MCFFFGRRGLNNFLLLSCIEERIWEGFQIVLNDAGSYNTDSYVLYIV